MSLAATSAMLQTVAGLLAIVFAAIVTPAVWPSVAAGVVVMWLACAYLLARVWWAESRPGTDSGKIVRAFFIGQGVKFVVLIVGVVAVMQFLTITWLPFLLGIIVVQVSSMLMSVRIKGKMAR